ncbi:LADA_0B02520g1_1 [Lachancea dasiensis]|uniref:LADA_0B02520g1_1 n=1 Tax=Lachancea dasiensis TaxID=1072105 RepID=A0A1G4IS54_9SACH|nr:LADA_0B02520g1_1 [Lachancea dasiensis]
MNKRAGLKAFKWVLKERVSQTAVQRFNAMLDHQFQPQLASATIDTSKVLSAGDHLLYFNPSTNTLSPDGYFEDQTPGFLLCDPTLIFRRRMWALGNMEFISPMKIDHDYECVETVRYVKRLGSDFFVGIDRAFRDCDTQSPATTEFRALIYTNKPVKHSLVSNSETAQNVAESTITKLKFLDSDIFRYSALTYNSHRIHWDRTYCRKVEGYNDIVVQGPFIIHTILKYMQRALGLKILRLKYKNTNFIYPGTDVEIHASQASMGEWKVEMRDATKAAVYCQAIVNATVG